MVGTKGKRPGRMNTYRLDGREPMSVAVLGGGIRACQPDFGVAFTLLVSSHLFCRQIDTDSKIEHVAPITTLSRYLFVLEIPVWLSSGSVATFHPHHHPARRVFGLAMTSRDHRKVVEFGYLTLLAQHRNNIAWRSKHRWIEGCRLSAFQFQ